jgi:methyltransferase
MNNNDRINLIHRISALEGLTDRERSALLGLLRADKTYGLVWEDKPEAVEERMQEELPVLREVPERALISDSKDAPNHILIEGDNLEALTTLAYTHAGRIDVIYIDPPYNTGNKDFVYNDSFVDREDTYRHSKWLSFMSRRLRIAKQLLSDKGVIFISIDDNEQAQLKLLCDEIFGDINKMGIIIWKKKTNGNNMGFIPPVHDYILVYAKNVTNLSALNFGYPITKEYLKKTYSNPDNDPRGPWTTTDLSANHVGPYYPITNPNTGKIHYPPKGRYWVFNEAETLKRIKEGRIIFGKTGTTNPVQKVFMKDRTLKRLTVESWWDKHGLNEDGTTDLNNIFESPKKFVHPKPVITISNIINISTSTNSIILDFFAGSGTTLHATMQLNAEDGGHRQCILVTNNENGICENVTYERNKRVICGYTTPKGEQVAGLTGNTLRYYKTDFVSRTRSVMNMRRLVNLSTDMLCIKEDLYAEQPTFCGERTYKNIFRYFSDGQKQMLVIYREEAIERLVELIYDMDVTDKIKIYVFSPSEDPWEDSFEDVSDKVELCALPAAIYNAYRRILPKKKDAATAQEEDATATQKAENLVNGMLNFTDEGDEA